MNFGELQTDILWPDEYTDFVAEITFRNTFVCRISQETGKDSMQIELMNNPVSPKWEFDLRDFENSIGYAMRRLVELRSVDNKKQ